MPHTHTVPTRFGYTRGYARYVAHGYIYVLYAWCRLPVYAFRYHTRTTHTTFPVTYTRSHHVCLPLLPATAVTVGLVTCAWLVRLLILRLRCLLRLPVTTLLARLQFTLHTVYTPYMVGYGYAFCRSFTVVHARYRSLYVLRCVTYRCLRLLRLRYVLVTFVTVGWLFTRSARSGWLVLAGLRCVWLRVWFGLRVAFCLVTFTLPDYGSRTLHTRVILILRFFTPRLLPLPRGSPHAVTLRALPRTCLLLYHTPVYTVRLVRTVPYTTPLPFCGFFWITAHRTVYLWFYLRLYHTHTYHTTRLVGCYYARVTCCCYRSAVLPVPYGYCFTFYLRFTGCRYHHYAPTRGLRTFGSAPGYGSARFWFCRCRLPRAFTRLPGSRTHGYHLPALRFTVVAFAVRLRFAVVRAPRLPLRTFPVYRIYHTHVLPAYRLPYRLRWLGYGCVLPLRGCGCYRYTTGSITVPRTLPSFPVYCLRFTLRWLRGYALPHTPPRTVYRYGTFAFLHARLPVARTVTGLILRFYRITLRSRCWLHTLCLVLVRGYGYGSRLPQFTAHTHAVTVAGCIQFAVRRTLPYGLPV